MPISGCHDLPLATFNLPSRNNLQNKPNSAATMSLPCSRFALSRSDCTGGWRWRTPGEFFHTLSDSRSPHGKKKPSSSSSRIAGE